MACFLYSLLCCFQSCSVRDFDSHATCHVGKFEVFPLATFWTLFLSYTVSCMFQTVDTYYRCCSSVSFIGNVAVPLLCISSLDDPVCTREAIPWDECR